MELATKSILSQNIICQSSLQTTLEEDINVPDTKPDIDKIVKLQSEAEILSVSPTDNKVHIKGQLTFSLLYTTTDDFQPIHNMQGQIPFQETVNLENMDAEKEVQCQFHLEDCQAKLIHSRKLSIRSLISFYCCQNNPAKLMAGTDIVENETGNSQGLHCRHKDFSFTEVCHEKKDILRVKDELTLPKGKESVDTLLFHDTKIQNLQTKMMEDGVRFLGDLQVFLLYVPENQERSLSFVEMEVPLDTTLSLEDCGEDVVPDIELSHIRGLMDIKEDEDGERRIVELELNVNLNMKFYREQSFHYLQDAYATSCRLNLIKDRLDCRKLLMKNQSISRINETISLGENQPKIEQLCSCFGVIKVDERRIQEDGICLEGVVELDVLYLTQSDDMPLACLTTAIPFNHVIEIKGISPDDDYELQTTISQISAIMLDNQELEVKISLNLCALVFTHEHRDVIIDIEESPLDMEELKKKPGLVGYIPERQEHLWDIAKKYNTTVESVMQLNNLDSQIVTPGQRILLMKQLQGI